MNERNLPHLMKPVQLRALLCEVSELLLAAGVIGEPLWDAAAFEKGDGGDSFSLYF